MSYQLVSFLISCYTIELIVNSLLLLVITNPFLQKIRPEPYYHEKPETDTATGIISS